MWSTRQFAVIQLINATIWTIILSGCWYIYLRVLYATSAGESASGLLVWCIISAAALFVATGGCWYALLGLHQFWASARMFGPISSGVRRAMQALHQISQASRSVGWKLPLMNSIAVVGLIGSLFLQDVRWVGLLFAIAGLRWWLWVHTATPPFVLFLSSSEDSSIEQHHAIKLSISPLRAISLLDIGHIPDRHVVGSLTLDCLRTEVDDDWWNVIKVLIEIAPIVVMNADVETAGVIREVQYLHSEDLLFKTIFFTEGDAPLLRHTPRDMRTELDLCTVSPGRVRAVLHCMLDRRLKPSRSKPVRLFLKLSPGYVMIRNPYWRQ